MKWLCLGDIVSSPGRSAVRDFLEDNRDCYDFVMANGENAAGGAGLTVDTARKLLDYGVDVLTGGNHIWQKNDFVEFLANNPDGLPVVRPANYPGDPPGRGYKTFRVAGLQILVVSLEGRTYMEDIDCPFRKADSIIQSSSFDLALVDFHAEATSEKIALANYLAGKVTAVVGTHTHVQTADEKLLPGRTAYITDLGMTGPRDSVIGVRSELAEKRFLTARPVRFKVEKEGPRIVNGLEITVDEDERQVVQLERVNLTLPQRTY